MSTASQEMRNAALISPPSPTKGDPSPVLDALADALAGALGSIVAMLAFYPIDIAKTRAQAGLTRDSSSPTSSFGRRKISTKITKRSKTSAAPEDAPDGLEKRGWWFRSRTLAALLSIVEEDGGFYKLYEGVDAKSLQTLVGSFVYFYAYAFIKVVMRRRTGAAGTGPKKSLPPSLNLLAAALAGAVNQAFTLPLENITTKMQVQTTVFDDPQTHQGRARGDVRASAAAAGVPAGVGTDGAETGWEARNTSAPTTGLEKGDGTSFCEGSEGGFPRHIGEERYCNIGDLKEGGNRVSDTTASSLSSLRTLSLEGMERFAGTVRQEGRNRIRSLPPSDRDLDADRAMAMVPDVIARDRGAVLLRTASQTEREKGPNEQKEPPPPTRRQRPRKSLATVALNLYREGSGIARFWRGFAPSLVLTCNPAINYTAFDLLKALWLKRRAAVVGTGTVSSGGFLNPLEAFFIAAAAKCLATLVTYPLIRAKVILMTSASLLSPTGAGSTGAQIDEIDVVLNERTSADNCRQGDYRAAAGMEKMPNRKRDDIYSEGLIEIGEPLAVSSAGERCREGGDDKYVSGMGAVLVDMFRQEGIGGLYAGCGAQLLHTILKSALLLATKEQIARAAASAVFFGEKRTIFRYQ